VVDTHQLLARLAGLALSSSLIPAINAEQAEQ
jgi:hypothetical protein